MAPQELLSSPDTEFSRALDELSVDIPEIVEQRDLIESGGQEIIESYGVHPEFFEDKAHSLFFAALAQRNGQLEEGKNTKSISSYTAEKQFIGDAVAMLVRDKADAYDSYKDDLRHGDEVSPEQLQNTYDRFTNQQMTQELQAAIDNGLLAEIKAKLGVTSENEDPYELHVLNIGNNPMVFSGMRPEKPQTQDEALLEEWRRDLQAYREYEAGLAQQTEMFATQTGAKEVAPAWVTRIDGKKLLNVPLPIAEKILHPEAIGLDLNDPSVMRSRNQDLSVLGHEYVHTQGGLNLDSKTSYGISFEERRAEYYSGDGAGYTEAKSLVIDLAAMRAFNIFRFFDDHPKGGSSYEFYSTIANQAGLAPMLELGLVAPENYAKSAPRLQANVLDYLGGQDDVVRRIYETRMTDSLKAAETHDSIDRWAINTMNEEKATGVDTATDWLNCRRTFGLSYFMSDRFEERLNYFRNLS